MPIKSFTFLTLANSTIQLYDNKCLDVLRYADDLILISV